MIKVKPSKTANHPKYKENKTVLITGAGGSIGCHVLNKVLQETSWRVIVTDSFRHKGYFDRIANIISGNEFFSSRVKVIAHDLTAPFTDREVSELNETNYIIHLASLSDVYDSVEHPDSFILNNCNVQVNILELARKLPNLEYFYHMSTDETKGAVKADSSGHKEGNYMNPSNPYAASKAAQECFCISYWKSYNLPIVIGNIMNNFGEMQSASKFNTIVQSKLLKGEKVTIHGSSTGEIGTRYFMHSENTADGILFILTHTEPRFHVPSSTDEIPRFNIAGDKQVSNLELAQLVAKLMGKELDYEIVNYHEQHGAHDMHYGLDSSYIKSLGWIPPLTFEESIERVINFSNENPQWIK
ncbi:TPA: NAD-dependent epimerase/dehydratase family protein [Klebsiella pneumoniae]|nr:NAD-dependent epimerase/dehydratase family protein [Klebsiella pneumoniae]